MSETSNVRRRETLEEYMDRFVAIAPPMTLGQKAKLAAIFAISPSRTAVTRAESGLRPDADSDAKISRRSLRWLRGRRRGRHERHLLRR
jgi:hypothetical protein